MCGFVVQPSSHSGSDSRLMGLRGPDRESNCLYSGFRLQHWLLDVNHCLEGQPVVGEHGALVWNGQIYGFLESARTERTFLRPGADDTAALRELILGTPLSLERFGEQIDAIDGEFAVCVVSAKGELFLASDAFGTKPVAFGFTRTGEPVAASYAEDLNDLGCVEVRNLRPGTVARLISGGRVEQRSHSQFRFTDFVEPDESVENFRVQLNHAVTSRLRTSDHVPLVKLSSGVDSGVIALLAMQSEVTAAYWTAPVGEDPDVVKLRTSRLTGAGFDVNHLYLSDEEFSEESMFIKKHFPRYSVSADGMRENFPDSRLSAIPGYVVGSSILRRAKAQGHMTELSGQGVDEIFTDYLGGSGIMASTDGSTSAFEKEWGNFRHGWMQAFLAASERIAGLHGFETRYPYLSKPFVQAFLNVPIEIRMKPEKSLLKTILSESDFGFAPRKVGFLGHILKSST